MATGVQPFKGRRRDRHLLAVATEDARPPQEINPDLPPALCDLVMRLLAKNPDQRPPSAVAVIEAIEAIERGAIRSPQGGCNVVSAQPAVARTAQSDDSPRRRALLVAAAIVGALLGLGGYLYGPTIVRFICNEGDSLSRSMTPKSKPLSAMPT